MTDPRAYELVVRRLLGRRLSREGRGEVKIAHRKRYRGASGQEYEIDLSFETTVADARLLVLIECKCYSRKVGLDDVAEFAYKVRDIGAHKGIFITTIGFDPGAVTIAVREGIALVKAVHQIHFISYKMAGFPPPYVIYSEDHRTYRLPKDRSPLWTDCPPPRMYITKDISADTTEEDIGFIPELEGFYGDPMNIFGASTVFLRENDLDSGQLKDIQWLLAFR